MKNIALIFAGGTGQRMGVKDVPKQFLEVDGKPIIIYTIEFFEHHKEIDEIYVVCIETWIDYLKYKLEKYGIKKVKSVIPGGKTGQDSIYLGLKEAEKYCNPDDIVLVHDGVRPFITEDLISNNLYTAGQPDPDLLIRTSRELRTSNFLPWQLVYTEFYFPDKHWPEFGEDDLLEAIRVYQKRNRRFGGRP